jgi:pentatricopeptide repeat protein
MFSSLLFVTTLVFQVPGSSASGFRPAVDVKQSSAPQAEASKTVTPEMRGDIFMARKMYREALETYKSGPDDSAVLANKIGIAYHQMLDLDDARKYYEKAIKLYKKALRLTPDSASILSNLGTSYFARKNYELAFTTYQQALALDPEVFEHRSTMGILLQERTVDERAKFHYYLARTYAKAGDVEHALVYIRKALEEGFKEPDKFTKDPEFAVIRDNPEFKLILSAEHKVL